MPSHNKINTPTISPSIEFAYKMIFPAIPNLSHESGKMKFFRPLNQAREYLGCIQIITPGIIQKIANKTNSKFDNRLLRITMLRKNSRTHTPK